MPNWMTNLIARVSGVSKLWGFMDGHKTKVAGVAGLLTGLAGIAAQLVPLIEGRDASAWLAFAKGLPNDQSWAMVVGGLAVLGLGHKAEKAAATPITIAFEKSDDSVPGE